MLALKRMNICFSSLLYDYLEIPELDYKGRIRNCELSFRRKFCVHEQGRKTCYNLTGKWLLKCLSDIHKNQAGLPLFGGLTWYVTSLMISLKSSSRSRSMPVEEATRVPSVRQTQLISSSKEPKLLTAKQAVIPSHIQLGDLHIFLQTIFFVKPDLQSGRSCMANTN